LRNHSLTHYQVHSTHTVLSYYNTALNDAIKDIKVTSTTLIGSVMKTEQEYHFLPCVYSSVQK